MLEPHRRGRVMFVPDLQDGFIAPFFGVMVDVQCRKTFNPFLLLVCVQGCTPSDAEPGGLHR
jgi:hypothetical protein